MALKTLRTRLFLVFISVICLGTVSAGLTVIESPATMRLKKIDEQRISDLREIILRANDIYSDSQSVPSNLEELQKQSEPRIKIVDPETGQPYGYRRIDSSSIEVCATFLASNKVSFRSARSVYFNSRSHPLVHDIGYHCFEFNLKDGREK